MPRGPKKGQGGRPSHPKESKVLRGTFRGDRAPTDVPTPDYGAPQIPAYLEGRAAEIWDELVSDLGPDGRNILTPEDGKMLATAAATFAAHESDPADQAIVTQLRQLSHLFGLDPSSRQRIPAVTKAKAPKVAPRKR